MVSADFQSDARPAPVALVTGGAVRVGGAISRALARDGFAVAVHHNGSEREAARLVGGIVKDGGSAVGLRCDLVDPGSAADLVERTLGGLGRLDVLVNSAALMIADDQSLTELARMKILNVDAPATLVEAAEPHLIENRGAVVNIGDVAGVIGFERHKAYSRTKAALLSLTQRKALELADSGVRVNCVCPGTVLFAQDIDRSSRRRITEAIPMKRIGAAEDVAEAVVYLARAGFVTGQVIAVDGGRLLADLGSGGTTIARDPILN